MQVLAQKEPTLAEQMKLFPIKEEKRAEIREKILAKHGIAPLNYIPTKRQIYWHKRILDEGINRNNLAEMESEIKEEKMIANIAFGGNLGDYRSFKTRILQENMDRELRLIKTGKHEIFVDEDELREFFGTIDVNNIDGCEAHGADHGPMLANHLQRGGSKTNFKPRSLVQVIYSDLGAKNTTFGYTIGQLQAELEPTHGIIPKPILIKIAKEINNSLADWESDMMNQNTGLLEKKAMEQITKYCKENATDDFEKSNDMGEKARKIVGTIGPELGKAIGKRIVDSEKNKSDSDSAKEAIANITATALKVGSKVYQEPLEESIYYTIHVLQGMLKK